MAQDEFAIIQRFFRGIGETRADTVLGMGDDAAVVDCDPGYQLVMSLDTLIAGVHFPLDSQPADIGFKALAVNLSDLAAMAAEPTWFLLSLSIPNYDESWLQAFSQGLRQCATEYPVQLIGGDTCAGELSVSIQISGRVPSGEFIGRAGAQPGDRVVVSGRLGEAGLGLGHLQGRVELPANAIEPCVAALNRPRPRLELTPFLRAFASAAIDVSDGLLGDLRHILDASGCGAAIEQSALPVSSFVRDRNLYEFALTAGDDYEICLTLPERHLGELEAWNREHPQCPLSVIGEITPSGYVLNSGDDRLDLQQSQGFRHFE